MHKVAALLVSLLMAGCATAEPTCIPWSDGCEPSTTYKWQLVTHFEEGRDAETSRTNQGRNPTTLAESECGRIPTPWHPEKVTRVEVTDTKTGETTSIDCSQVRS
ncbi:MAG: hypothetical protein JJU06_12660 [Ectothiorhodospiraceae bacterium]|nr:hypothetical protein [Ectothiorhodospiraceae bacterium]